MKSLVDVFGHAFGDAAVVDMRAVLQPGEKFGVDLEHAVLNVDFFLLIAGERGVEAGEETIALERFQFVAIEEVAGRLLVAEEKPVLAG